MGGGTVGRGAIDNGNGTGLLAKEDVAVGEVLGFAKIGSSPGTGGKGGKLLGPSLLLLFVFVVFTLVLLSTLFTLDTELRLD